jgi:hypothetical protein
MTEFLCDGKLFAGRDCQLVFCVEDAGSAAGASSRVLQAFKYSASEASPRRGIALNPSKSGKKARVETAKYAIRAPAAGALGLQTDAAVELDVMFTAVGGPLNHITKDNEGYTFLASGSYKVTLPASPELLVYVGTGKTIITKFEVHSLKQLGASKAFVFVLFSAATEQSSLLLISAFCYFGGTEVVISVRCLLCWHRL